MLLINGYIIQSEEEGLVATEDCEEKDNSSS